MTQILYNSTRNNQNKLTAAQAIVKGIANDGGLYVPETMPTIDLNWDQLKDASYQTIAKLVLGAFFTDFTEDEIAYCVDRAYDDKFDNELIAPLKAINEQVSILELFHGNTIAFKDMALSILPYLLTTAAKKLKIEEEIVILTATSGDTGKAALAGFSEVPNTRIVVFYPKDGVSDIQERQMVTQEGNNTKVVAVKGNFDDAQTKVKELFNDQALNKQLKKQGFLLSSANSINIGRLVPQVVYYVYSYAQLLKNGAIKSGDQINVSVPTGNFGNILAAYFAKLIGVPIEKLICASNRNNVLVDFFNEGIYDRRRPFYLTSSPSMDILVSSNLERLIYLLNQRQDEPTKEWMEQLIKKGSYQITQTVKEQLTDFYANEADDVLTATTIKEVYQDNHYILDPHTAVAYAVYQQYLKETQSQDRQNVTVIAGTASPYKFPESVLHALEVNTAQLSGRQLIEKLAEISQIKVPSAIKNLFDAPIRHQEVVEIEEMKETILRFLIKH